MHIREGRAPIRGIIIIIIIRDYRPPSHKYTHIYYTYIYPPRRVVSIHTLNICLIYIYIMCVLYADNNRVGRTLRRIERIPRGCGIVRI